MIVGGHACPYITRHAIEHILIFFLLSLVCDCMCCRYVYPCLHMLRPEANVRSIPFLLEGSLTEPRAGF